MIKYLSQKGEDGFGHQIFGMMSLISLTSNDVKYVPYLHDGKFEHITPEEKIQLKDYIIEFYKKLGFKFPCDYSEYPPKRILSRNRNNFNYDNTKDLDWSNHTHVFDNAWSQIDIGKMVYNYGFYDSINNSKLVESKFDSNYTNIVIHLRGGDGATRFFGTKQNMSILNLIIKKIKSEYPNYMFNFHTNDIIDKNLLIDIQVDRYKVFDKTTNILFTFSQMVHSDILVVGDSSLSIAASYVNKGLVLVPSKLTCADKGDININPIYGNNKSITFENYLSI